MYPRSNARDDRRSAAWILAGLVLTGMSGALARAQQPLPTFEVASIRANKSLPVAAKAALASGGVRMFAVGKGPLAVSGDYVRIKAITLAELIHIAYGLPTNNVKEFYVRGLASWALPGGDYYDIEARVPGEAAAKPEQVRLMLQSLLNERFRLVLHQEVKEEPAYDLVINKGGLRMKQMSKAPWPALAAGRLRRDFPAIVLEVSRYLDRPLIDRTELSGVFEYTVLQGADETSIFALAQDLLGLKILAAKEQLKVLVIERAEKPSGN